MSPSARSLTEPASGEETRERILAASVELIQRFGHDRFRVTDVGKALGMTHANVYRYFDSKEALLAEVVRRWLGRLEHEMAKVLRRQKPAAERLVDFAVELHRLKKEKITKDRPLFDAMHALAKIQGPVVAEHVEVLHRDLVALIEEGVAAKEFKVKDPDRAARAFKASLAAFHDPRILINGIPENGARKAADIAALLIAGFRAGLV